MPADYNLNRFITAQENVYQTVLHELRTGRKTSHWMWFIFPQIDGLGFSSTTKFYSIKSIDEATDYLNHALLGKRLIECSNIVLEIEGKSVMEIFGSPDNSKLQSCMTLFDAVSPETKVFANVLQKYFNNVRDNKTLSILKLK